MSGPVTPPTREEVDKAVKAARPDARDAIRVAAATGLRRGELFALRWRDIDFDQNLIYVRTSNFGGRIAKTTKTTAGRRTVPLFVSIRQLLLERKAREPFSLDHDFRARRRGAPHFRFHDLRHFAVSQLIEQRADIVCSPGSRTQRPERHAAGLRASDE
jgi:integrase